MEDIFKMIYYSIGAMIFASAISILIYCDSLMDREYDYILYDNKYTEVNIRK